MFSNNAPIDKCLNCGTELQGEFCHNCAQRASTRRFSLRTLWDGQFIEDVFQVNRGLLRTLLELLYRPGRVAADYIGGHRRRYFNFLTLLLLLVAADLLLREYSTASLSTIFYNRHGVEQIETTNPAAYAIVLETNYRLVFVITLPLLALFQALLLRRTRMNYWEHVVAASFLMSAQALYCVAGDVLPLLLTNETALIYNYRAVAIMICVINFLFYWQYTRGFYPTFFDRCWRVILLGLLASVCGFAVIEFLVGFNDPAGNG
ncbi:DUF3667 domain-containing protein [Neolewinella antarctica]|uniref:DUF3667 domain-containing protein n=1 Tax=Neolewinella antarctica TaxID=442734 RepID=A0ABX0X7N5_9BACT|nr:DUF3667 domain-containing protein [Neolewinella antarctica]NJC25245.1 hypothetical protein [Neolewinella antarctica]